MELLDWGVMAAYGIVVLVIGWRAGRGHQSTEDFFLGNRRMPWWAVLCSMVATELSAATYIAVPEKAFGGNWSYLQYAIGSLLARIVLATWFLSLYHRLRLVTVYGFLEKSFGRKTQLGGAWCFLVGRVMASGSRLYIAGFAFSTVTDLPIEWSILLAGALAALYTLAGGIRAVIWTDTLQGAVFMIAAVAALYSVFAEVGTASLSDEAWIERTRIFVPETFWVAVIGGFFLTLATHGTDQDMVQRLLTTRTGRGGGRALILSGFANFPIVLVFLALGTGLFIYYSTGKADHVLESSKHVFPEYVYRTMPAGLRGLIFAGLFAAAMSSMDSALNSLATTWVVDIRRGITDARLRLRETKIASAVFGVLLVAAAVFFVVYERTVNAGTEAPTLNLIDLALSSMAIVYGALLGAFLLALIAQGRGNDVSVTVGLAAGSAVGIFLFLQPILWKDLMDLRWEWRIPITAGLTFLIGICAPRPATMETARDA